MSGKFTDGEWAVIHSKDVFDAVISPGLATICIDVENPHDAILIAAAKDLLAACKAVVDGEMPDEKTCNEFGGYVLLPEIREALVAAISKASPTPRSLPVSEGKTLTFGSLFTGIGGFDLGFERAGMQCKWQVEINPFCQRVLAKHWPSVRRHDDVRTFPPSNPDEWRVDVLCAGDPCQENSNARIYENTRSPSLGAELIRVVELLCPRIVVRENPTRVRANAPWPWWRIRNEFERLGYLVLPFRLRACCAGAKHQRDRLFVLAEHADSDSQRNWVQGRSKAVSQAGRVQKEAQKREWVRPDVQSMVCGEALHANGVGLERVNGEGESEKYFLRTSSNPRGAERWNYDVPTSRICRSRNDVPDYVDRITALGNSVVPQVAEWIGRRIIEAVPPPPPPGEPGG